LDFKKVIDACAANGVVIEINTNRYRLDMDWSHVPYALEKGVMISINPDAHSMHEIDNIRWSVSAARKGGLTKAMTGTPCRCRQSKNGWRINGPTAEKLTPTLKNFQPESATFSAFLCWHKACNELVSLINLLFNYS
jgi:hypothetical protein